MKTKNLLFVAILCICINTTWAQTNQQVNAAVVLEKDNCKAKITQNGINMENQRDQNAYRQLLQQHMQMPEVITEYTLQIHIIQKDDGTGGISVATIRNEFMNWVNPYFAAVNAKFVECSPEIYHNSTTYYNLSGDAEGDAMSVDYNVANVINMYFVNDPDDACGWARFPWDLPSDYVVIANSCADNQSTIVHELGHYFSLYHTHETAFGAENVTRNNADGCYDCDTDGDKLCDTPADPTLNIAAVTITPAPACAYSSALMDACSVSYTPDPTLIMSYSEKACRTVFTASQKAKMTLTMASAPGNPLYGRNYLQTSCPCEPAQAICKNINVNLNSSGSATISASDVDNGSTYDCGLASMTVSPNTFDCSDKGNNVVTLTVTDNIGWVKTCQATVTIADVTNPQITNPASNLTVPCDGSGNVADFNNWINTHGGATANDACGGSWSDNHTPLVYGCGGTAMQTVTFTFTDPSNNSNSTIATFTIEDKVDPSVTCPANIHLPECVATATWTIVASDICGSVTIVSVPPSGSVFPKGTTTVVNVTVTDECGNDSQCSFTVTRDPDLTVSIAAVPTSALNTCALGTSANIVLGYGGGPTCRTLSASASGGHGPYTYSWVKPAIVPSGSFTNSNTATPTFCASFQTVACATYTFTVTTKDIHGCTETNSVDVNVINPLCTTSNNPKVSVCHGPPGNVSNANSICIASNAVNTHLGGHPDCLGGCDAVCQSYSARMKSPTAFEEILEPYQILIQPNPFSTTAVINITASYNTKASLAIFDYSGRLIATLYEGELFEGVSRQLDFDASQMQSGIYLVRLMGADGVVTHETMVVTK